MNIQASLLEHWIGQFYGYGSWDARVWFVGYEEGGGDLPEEVAEKFSYFSTRNDIHPALCDIREMYRRMAVRIEGPKGNSFATYFDYRFGPNSQLHGAWKNLIAFSHGYQNKALPDLLAYQRNSFVSPSESNQAMIPLYPLPSPHNHAWYYSWLDMPQFPFLKSRALYEVHVYEARIYSILDHVRLHRPELVVMYGMNNIVMLKKSVVDFFPAARFRLAKAVKLKIPQYHRADLSGTTLLISTQIPTLRHQRVETGFDWYEFGKAAR